MNPDAADRPDLETMLGRFPSLHVWVAGDLMLDEYVVGDVERVSPEAPVPVVHVRESMSRLGGAANVARQTVTLGAHTSLCGGIGTDAAGDELLTACARSGIDARAIGRLEDCQTTRKLRVLGHQQQLLRLDWEKVDACPPGFALPLIEQLREGRPPDALVISDYAKGFLTDQTITALIEAAAEHGAPVLVDPKRRDLAAYRGATVIKPNLYELGAVTGRSLGAASNEVIADAARSAAIDAGVEMLVVTLGDRGMLIVPAAGPHEAVRARRRAVYDVTGAGDTVISTLALALAADANLRDAAELATIAAGIAVGEIGAAAVTPARLLAELAPQRVGKVMTRRGLAAQVQAWRLQGKRVVFTNGCFDLMHIGHLSLLREAARLGDVLVVAINSDASVQRLKGDDRPLVPQDERVALIAALDCVDAVTTFDEDTPLETLQQIRPDVLVKGQDYEIHEVVGRELVESNGGRVELVPLLPERSTSQLIERIRKRNSD
jgi:D-beta-D-heptose 7-phosphate kinase/D-beta-D-heptose 1-phosphate adenosyltransferase